MCRPGAIADLTGQAHDLAVAAYKAHELAKLSVPAGIISGLTGRRALQPLSSNINLPSYLTFFGGRRFVPIASGFAGLVYAWLFGMEWQHLEDGMDCGQPLSAARGCIRPVRLWSLESRADRYRSAPHHQQHRVVYPRRLSRRDGGSEALLRRRPERRRISCRDFFPVMMFGLPAACLAMYHTALPERRRAVGVLLASIALTSL